MEIIIVDEVHFDHLCQLINLGIISTHVACQENKMIYYFTNDYSFVVLFVINGIYYQCIVKLGWSHK